MTAYFLGELSSTPLGPISVAAGDAGLARVHYGALAELATEERFRDSSGRLPVSSPYLEQLAAYLAGTLRGFSLEIDWRGMPPFTLAARRACFAIPYGQVITYTELAARAGSPKAVRAAGAAMALNPMPLVIPCHRVVGSDGSMHGYAGPEGIETKAWLLRLEGKQVTGGKLA